MGDVGRSDDIVDVIIPVFNNFGDTRRLFESLVAARNATRIVIRVIDDASTEGGGLDLPEKSERILDVSFARNDSNQGFAACVNAGIAASRRDVVILNTDTLVFGDWLDRLKAAAAGLRIATATPFSNAATILSYPVFIKDSHEPLEISWADLDGLCRALAPKPVEIPTGIGFCMLIKRACLEAIGGFDAEAFGSGYGEESDFCRRAIRAGWRHVGAPNVFVWHRGSGSFGTRASSLRDAAEERLRTRHPEYARVVSRFIRRDPLRADRMRLDFARLRRAFPTTVLSFRGPDAHLSPGTITLAPTPSRWPAAWRPHVAGMGPLPNLPRFTRFATRRAIRHFLKAANANVITAGGDAVPRGLAARFRAAAAGRRQSETDNFGQAL